MRVTIYPLAIILTAALWATVSMIAKGYIVACISVFLIFTTQLYYYFCIIMHWFSYLDKREVLQQEYSQPPILPSPHFRWVVN